jgi:hypothetical protein
MAPFLVCSLREREEKILLDGIMQRRVQFSEERMMVVHCLNRYLIFPVGTRRHDGLCDSKIA